MVVGGFFGDEGKGKIVGYLAVKDDVEIAVRGGVGPNAGHTVVHQGRRFRLRMLPSAVINPNTKLRIGAGVLVDPRVLIEEINEYGANNRVRIDKNCGIIDEKHVESDNVGHLKEKIATTGTGTGPANADRVLRKARIANEVKELKNLIGDVSLEINEAVDKGKRVLVEGTQGTFLSLYHGTYPYVTSKDVCASAICSDVGIGPKKVDDILVVFKAYVTRVGTGPLAGEISKEEAERLGWQEYGAVTGRPRRVAPFNFELAKRAVMLNSATEIAVTKLDAVFKDAHGIRDYEKLPKSAKKYIERIEEELGLNVSLIGTGPEALDTIDRR